ncbi:MAG: alpha/beta fold hydrolase [Myxococcota bacterium]|jgi:alpha-beta hydrolase superfamily lysophospholipase
MASTSGFVWSNDLVIDTYTVTTSDGQPLVMERFRSRRHLGTQGLPVMLVHGLGQNRYTWYSSRISIPKYLADMGMDVYVPELRGHGLSHDAGSVHPASFAEYVIMDIPALLEKVHALTGGMKLFFVGHSLGGTIAYALEPAMERYLAGIVTLGAPLRFARGLLLMRTVCQLIALAYRYTPLRSAEVFDKRLAFPAELYGKMLLFTRGLQDSWLNLWPYKAWYPGSFDTDVLDDRLALGFDRTSFEMMKFMIMWAGRGRLFDQTHTTKFEKNLQSRTLPVLFFIGDRDCVVPVESVLPAYKKMRVKDKAYVILGDDKRDIHWGHLDIVLGREASKEVWGPMASWMLVRAERATGPMGG